MRKWMCRSCIRAISEISGHVFLGTRIMLQIAFKEWAVICKALAEGKQAIILRKGGIAEVGGQFKPEHSRFWLYPTYLHEHREGIKAQALPLLERAIQERLVAGMLRLTHFAEVTGVYDVR